MSSQTTGGEKQTMDAWLDSQFNAPSEPASHDGNADPAVETPSSETPPAAESQAQGETPPAGAPTTPNWKLKLKEDGAESDLDLEEYARDEAKRSELVAWVQKGRQHEKVVERRLKEHQQQTSEWLLAEMQKSGYNLAYNQKTGRLEVTPVNGAPNTTATPTNGAARAADNGQTPDLTDPNQIRARIAALRPKVADGEADAIAEVVDLQDKLTEAVSAANTKPLRDYVEHLKQMEAQREQAAAVTARTTIRERTLAAFKRHDATFAGLTEDQRITIAQGLAARLGPDAKIEALEAQIDAWAQNEAQRLTARLQSAASPPQNGTPRAPAPAAPPVHGGRPPAAGGGSNQSNLPKSSFEAGWADRLIP